MNELERVIDLLHRAARRLRLQRGLLGLTLAATPLLCTLAAAMLAIQLGALDRGQFPLLLSLSAALVGLAVTVGLAWPVHLLDIAYRLDRANGNADRLGSALEFSALGPERTSMMEAQLRDAVAHLAAIDISRAYPWRVPRSARALLLASLLVGVAALYETPPAPRALGASPVPPPEELLLRPIDLAAQREVARQLRAEAERLDDAGLRQVADRFDELLDKMERRKINRESALQALEQLRAAARQPPPNQQQLEELTAELAAVGQELGQDKEPELEPLAEALAQKDLAAAREELARLARLLASDKLSGSQLERLAKAFGSLAKKLAEKLDSRDIEALRKEIGLLRQKMSSRGLGTREEQRLRQLEQQLTGALEKQGGTNPGADKTNEGLRALNQLHRKADEAARQLGEAARQQTQPGRNPAQQQAGEQTQRQAGKKVQEGAEAMEQLQRQRAQAKARQQAEQAMQQTEEVMKRSSQSGAQAQQRTAELDDFDQRAAEQGRGDRPDARSRGQGGDGPGERRPPTGGQPDPKSGGAPAGDGQGTPGGEGQRPQPDGAGARQPEQLGRQGEQAGAGKEAGRGGDGGQGSAAATANDARFKDEQLTGQRGAGASRSEVIRGAAERGFAQRGYRQVFGGATQVAEEELERVRIPAGYRFIVRRYFELIRPRE